MLLFTSSRSYFSKISVFKNFTEFTKKNPPIPEFLCNKVTDPQSESLLRKRPGDRCVSVIFAKFLKTPFYKTPPGDYFCFSGRYLKTCQILY